MIKYLAIISSARIRPLRCMGGWITLLLIFSCAEGRATATENAVAGCINQQLDLGVIDLDAETSISDVLDEHKRRAEQLCSKAIGILEKERAIVEDYARLVQRLDRESPFKRIARVSDDVLRTRDSADNLAVQLAQKELPLSKESNVAFARTDSALSGLSVTRLSWASKWAQLHLMFHEEPFDTLVVLQKDPITPPAAKASIQTYFDSFPPYMTGKGAAPTGALDRLTSSVAKLDKLLELRRQNYRGAQYKVYLESMRSTLSPESRKQADREIVLKIIREFDLSSVVISGQAMLANGVYLAPRQVTKRLIARIEDISQSLNLADPDALLALEKSLAQMKELTKKMENVDESAMAARLSSSIQDSYNTIVTRHHPCLKKKPDVFDALDRIDELRSAIQSLPSTPSLENRRSRQEMRELVWLVMSSVLSECEGT